MIDFFMLQNLARMSGASLLHVGVIRKIVHHSVSRAMRDFGALSARNEEKTVRFRCRFPSCGEDFCGTLVFNKGETDAAIGLEIAVRLAEAGRTAGQRRGARQAREFAEHYGDGVFAPDSVDPQVRAHIERSLGQASEEADHQVDSRPLEMAIWTPLGEVPIPSRSHSSTHSEPPSNPDVAVRDTVPEVPSPGNENAVVNVTFDGLSAFPTPIDPSLVSVPSNSPEATRPPMTVEQMYRIAQEWHERLDSRQPHINTNIERLRREINELAGESPPPFSLRRMRLASSVREMGTLLGLTRAQIEDALSVRDPMARISHHDSSNDQGLPTPENRLEQFCERFSRDHPEATDNVVAMVNAMPAPESDALVERIRAATTDAAYRRLANDLLYGASIPASPDSVDCHDSHEPDVVAQGTGGTVENAAGEVMARINEFTLFGHPYRVTTDPELINMSFGAPAPRTPATCGACRREFGESLQHRCERCMRIVCEDCCAAVLRTTDGNAHRECQGCQLQRRTREMLVPGIMCPDCGWSMTDGICDNPDHGDTESGGQGNGRSSNRVVHGNPDGIESGGQRNEDDSG